MKLVRSHRKRTQKRGLNSQYSILITVIVLAIFVPTNLMLAWHLNIWTDEAFSLNTSEQSICHAIHQSLYFEMQPPLYFVILTAWRKINGSIFFARLLSIGFTVVCICLSAKLSRRYLPHFQPGWFIFLFAFNPLTYYAALDIRLYGLVLLLSMLAFLFFYDAFLIRCHNSSRSRIAYIIVCLCGLWTQYFFGFIILAGGLALICYAPRASFLQYLRSSLFIGIGFLPSLSFFHQHFNGHQSMYSSLPGYSSGLDFIARRILEYSLPTPTSPSFKFILLGLVIGSAIVTLSIKGPRKPTRIEGIVTVVFIALVVIFLALSYQVGPRALASRHTTILLLPVLFVLLTIIRLFCFENSIRIILCTIVVGNCFALFEVYKGLAKDGDFIHASRIVMTNELVNQPIFFFVADRSLAFAHYYRGSNPLVPLPFPEDFKKWDMNEWKLDDVNQILSIVQKYADIGSEIWLYTSYVDCSRHNPYNCRVLEMFLESYCSVNFNQVLRGCRLRRFLIQRPLVGYAPQYPSSQKR